MAIVHQQLSTGAATTIFDRVKAELNAQDDFTKFTPAGLTLCS
jgi:3-methyladenine DNA glycosylase/8-oxoguanine DNA glycosylase